MKTFVLLGIAVYFVIVNLVGFFLMRSDKRRAQDGKWRIREGTFFGVSFIGGGIGTLVGMYAFRHKTKHASFVIGIPACMLCGLALVGCALYFAILYL